MDEGQLDRLRVSASLQSAIPGPASTGAGNYSDNHVNNDHHGTNTDTIPNQQSQRSLAAFESRPAKQQRKRNKPSLSCETCTVKKTKCDRGRPVCFACLKRRSECTYSQLANLIEESHQSSDQSPRRKSKSNGSSIPKTSPAAVERHYGPARPEKAPSRSSTGSSPRLLSNIPFSHPTASNLFKAEHPFR